MKFLLTAINAKFIHSNPAIYSLRAYCGEAFKEHIQIAEYTINNSLEQILSGLYFEKPDVIGISCYIWNYVVVERVLTELPKILPGVPIWLGGPEVSYNAREVLEKHPNVTGIMVGEGELTFKALMERYVVLYKSTREENDDLNETILADGGIIKNQIMLCDIPGIVYRDEEGIHETKPRSLTDISELPFLYQDLDQFENRIIYYETSRGCPYRCSYCLSSIDKTVRLRNLDVVKKELQFFLDQKVDQVKFVDRTFNCNKVHAEEIWNYIIAHDNGVTNFHFEIEGDLISEEQLAILKSARPGLMQMEIGVQTANPVTLEEIRRNAKLDRIKEVVAAIQKNHNIHLHLDLIAGLPYEDYESFGMSFDEVYSMHPEQLQLGFLKVLKGSYMHEKAKDYEIKYLSEPPYEVLSTKWIRYEDILQLKKIEEMVELYYNSNQYRNVLSVLEKWFDTPFRMYEAMATFYDKKGYFVFQPARSYRYQVLLEFIETVVEVEYVDYFREILTFDVYLRENCKTRPAFAKDMSEYKEHIKNFYIQEKENPKYLVSYEAYDSKQMSKMTHMELFQYPVWDREYDVQDKVGNRKEDSIPQMILFDYEKRDPLTYDATYFVVS